MAAQLIEKTIDSENLDLINIIKNETTEFKILNSLYFFNDKINFIKTKKENIHEIIRYSIFKLQQQKKSIRIIENFDPSLAPN